MRNSILILFICCTASCFAYDSLTYKVNIPSIYFTTDNLDNIYLISTKNEIIKFSVNDSTYITITYSNKNLGKPSYIDVANPLKILVFYPDHNSIVLLSNKLAELSIIQFNNFNNIFYQPVAVCKEAESDLIWIYDDLTQKLFKLDETGNVVVHSESFDQLFDFSITQPKLFSVNNTLFLYTENAGVLLFDTYANYSGTYTQPADELQQVNEDFLIALSGDKIILFNIRSATLSEILSPELQPLQVNIRDEYIFLRTSEYISVQPLLKH